MAFLQGPSIKQAELIKQELGEGPGDLDRCVRDLQSMLAASPYLPQPDDVGPDNMLRNVKILLPLRNNNPAEKSRQEARSDRNLLEHFVRGCRMNMERSRAKLEAFCIARSRHRDLYMYRSLSEPPLNEVCKFMDIATLPKLTDDGLRVTIFRVRAGYPENSADIVATVRAILLISDARMRDEKLITGDVFVYEISQVRASLAARMATAAGVIRRGIQLAQSAYPQRLKRIHVVGAPTFFASSLQLMRSCVNEKIKKRYYLHAKIEELLDHIPARVLPEEWGGEEESIDIIVRKWRCRVDESRDFIRRLNSMCTTAPAPISDTDIYGTVGAFRKLDID